MPFTFHRCTIEDIDTLITIGKETYFETFSSLNTPENMAAYLASAFNREKIATELGNENSTFLFLYREDQLSGYLKTNIDQAQTDLRESDGLEIERIYVRKQFQRQGLGKVLMEKGIEIARQEQKKYVWLGVWEQNETAITFYKKMGFEKIGTHDFYMGTDRQTDYIMKKELDPKGFGNP